MRSIYLSLYSRGFYFDLIQNKRMLGAKYLLLLSLIISVPVSIKVKMIITNFFTEQEVSTDDNINYIASQMPDVFVEGNFLKFRGESNYIINSKVGKAVVIVDVEEKISDLKDYEKIAVVDKSGFRYKLADGKGIVVIPSSDIIAGLNQYLIGDGANSKLNKEKFFNDLKILAQAPILLIFILSFLWFYTNNLVSALLFSFITGILFALICRNYSFDFKQCFRIAAFTLTPVLYLETISNMLGNSLFSNASLVYFVAHLLYIHFAIESYKKLRK